ncbi:MAG TPA: branched-chain amino acid ABC transporter permease [Rhodocyclaceae bacterium]|nr:MAG: branched-chain amino acid ABC transporter permease [Betaproteobacteria bacterium CG2_30_68_42]PIX76405.1 MAG: branched-chain amino acid ABC transporter permease [Rhodocyclales bacterium CG_4_10_14_3_um_filter_68_10]PJA57879.1 MAG: branched-chain amino acid ABC transporter permease [Rhodocyclales bacterium CG_4_9_14_3_um_filter_68_10]HCX34389.1 branched-chain amino acid ABC transporter permease [Rhodocyclaceae bacterium]
MFTLTAILVDGTIYASWLFIVAAGLTLVYGVMRILNLAHGSLYAVGAYTAASAITWYLSAGHAPAGSYLVLLAAALAAGTVTGLLIERGVLRLMYGRDEVVMILVTYAVLLILEDVIKLIWGVESYSAYQPYQLLGRLQFGPMTFANYDLALIAVAAAVAIAMWWTLNRTRRGKLLLVVIHDREMSAALGIDVTRVFVVTFLIGGVLGAAAGALTAPVVSVVPGIGVEVIVLAFAVVVIGGLGSVQGALVGSLIVGIARAAAVHLLPEVELFVIYGVMCLVLAVRPAGLFARPAARKI